MTIKTLHFFFPLVAMFLIFFSCAEPAAEETPEEAATTAKSAILSVLNNETIAAFSRDYDGWKSHWVQEAYVTKTYMNFADSTLTETLGWADVNQFVVDYFAEHPEPDQLPEPLTDIDVRLYGDGAWVSYEQNDPGRGLKRETRLMERHGGKWKIAGMQTVIYGE